MALEQSDDETSTRVLAHRRTATERLELRAVSDADLEVLYNLHADPAVWTVLPSARHTSREQTERDVAKYVADWERAGLGYWTAWRRDDGQFVGIGGVRLRDEGIWNVYYRLAPAQQGQSFAVELGRAALRAAAQVEPAPVTAFLLEHNHPSRVTAERLGLHLVWRGPDAGNPDPDAVRLVYSDRSLEPEQLEAVTR